MKRRLVTTVIFLLTLCTLLVGCTYIPYAPRALPQGTRETFTIYVCGAVENEGYYSVDAGTSWTSVIELAGLLPQSELPQYYTDTVDSSTSVIVVDYFDGTSRCSCINANSPLIAARAHVEGIPDEAVGLLADWIEQNGAFHNKKQVIAALGAYAETCHYRLYVAKEDYATD